MKKGDPPRELPSLPKLPTTFTEVWSLASGLFNDSTKASSTSDPCNPEKLEVIADTDDIKVYPMIPIIEPADDPEECDISDIVVEKRDSDNDERMNCNCASNMCETPYIRECVEEERPVCGKNTTSGSTPVCELPCAF